MKPIIDFQILPNFDPRFILIGDNSSWEHASEKVSIIEITLPGSSKKITHYFHKEKINSYNTVNLDLACEAPCDCEGTGWGYLPDGIYTFKVIASPSTFYSEKTHLQTAQLRLTLDKAYVDMMLQCEKVNLDKRQQLEEIEFVLTAAEANTHLGNFKDAYDLFMKAKSLVDKCVGCSNCS